MHIKIQPTVLALLSVAASAIILAAVFLHLDRGEILPASASGRDGTTLIIDAGHGGADGGAVSITGSCESEINLQVCLKMQAISELTATPYLMTRDSDELQYPPEADSIAKKKIYDQRQRQELIISTQNAVLISVHQNKYPTAQPRGPQAFYAQNEVSRSFALRAQENLNMLLYPENRRVAAPVPEMVFLFKELSCPAILAECGFLSNAEEARLLVSAEHQTKAALALMSSYFQFIAPVNY